MTKRTKACLFVLALGLCSATPALAQNPHVAQHQKGKPNPDAHKRAELQARMHSVRAKLLRERVGLGEKAAVTVEQILDKYQAERKKLQDSLREERRKLRAMLDLDQNDQAAYSRALRSMLDAQQKLAKLRQQEFDELAKVLSPKQQAKLLRVTHETMSNLRKKMKGKRWDSGD